MEAYTQDQYKISIRLFGAVELENSLGSAAENPSRRSLSWLLLKYLLLNRGREVSQEELDTCLWTGAGEACDEVAARVRLRRLREALRPLGLDGRRGLVLYSMGKYMINPQIEIVSDEDEFRALLGRLRGLDQNAEEGPELCRRALELMRGEYMHFCPDAAWLRPYREHYRHELAELAGDCIARCRALGQNGPMELLCRRCAAIIPENEAVHREILSRLMERGMQIELLHYVAQLTRGGGADWIEKT